MMMALLVGCNARKGPPPPPPPPTVTLAHPRKEAILEYGEYTGYTEAIQRIEIRPQVKGRLMKVHVPEGTEIEKGTLLYEIDPSEYIAAMDRAVATKNRAEADEKKADAELLKAEADLRRVKPLRGSNAISEEQYLQYEVAEKTAVAAKAQARAAIAQAASDVKTAELNLGYTKIYAPISGRVSRTQITEGNLVGYDNGTGVPLTIMVDVDPIYVYFDVPERDIIEYESWAKPIRKLGPELQALGFPLWVGLWSESVIPFEVGIETEPGYPHQGWINFREPRFESGTGTLRVRGLLDNGSRKMSSGMYARVRFPRRWPHELLTIPAEAMMSGQQGRYVYLAVPPAPDENPPPPVSPDPEKLEVLKVKGPFTIDAGMIVNRRLIVKEQQTPDQARALSVNDRVIVEGIQKVRPGGYVFAAKTP